jgi:hypothetical protein
MSEAGWDETWIELYGIMTCRMTCGFSVRFDRVC